jgi:hypothetical protein
MSFGDIDGQGTASACEQPPTLACTRAHTHTHTHTHTHCVHAKHHTAGACFRGQPRPMHPSCAASTPTPPPEQSASRKPPKHHTSTSHPLSALTVTPLTLSCTGAYTRTRARTHTHTGQPEVGMHVHTLTSCTHDGCWGAQAPHHTAHAHTHTHHTHHGSLPQQPPAAAAAAAAAQCSSLTAQLMQTASLVWPRY